jgi:hypothetical protein
MRFLMLREAATIKTSQRQTNAEAQNGGLLPSDWLDPVSRCRGLVGQADFACITNGNELPHD